MDDSDPIDLRALLEGNPDAPQTLSPVKAPQALPQVQAPQPAPPTRPAPGSDGPAGAATEAPAAAPGPSLPGAGAAVDMTAAFKAALSAAAAAAGKQQQQQQQQQQQANQLPGGMAAAVNHLVSMGGAEAGLRHLPLAQQLLLMARNASLARPPGTASPGLVNAAAGLGGAQAAGLPAGGPGGGAGLQGQGAKQAALGGGLPGFGAGSSASNAVSAAAWAKLAMMAQQSLPTAATPPPAAAGAAPPPQAGAAAGSGAAPPASAPQTSQAAPAAQQPPKQPYCYPSDRVRLLLSPTQASHGQPRSGLDWEDLARQLERLGYRAGEAVAMLREAWAEGSPRLGDALRSFRAHVDGVDHPRYDVFLVGVFGLGAVRALRVPAPDASAAAQPGAGAPQSALATGAAPLLQGMGSGAVKEEWGGYCFVVPQRSRPRKPVTERAAAAAAAPTQPGGGVALPEDGSAEAKKKRGRPRKMPEAGGGAATTAAPIKGPDGQQRTQDKGDEQKKKPGRPRKNPDNTALPSGAAAPLVSQPQLYQFQLPQPAPMAGMLLPGVTTAVGGFAATGAQTAGGGGGGAASAAGAQPGAAAPAAGGAPSIDMRQVVPLLLSLTATPQGTAELMSGNHNRALGLAHDFHWTAEAVTYLKNTAQHVAPYYGVVSAAAAAGGAGPTSTPSSLEAPGGGEGAMGVLGQAMLQSL